MLRSVGRSTALRAAFSWMLAVFSGLAFVLAIGGAYGVAAHLVTQRPGSSARRSWPTVSPARRAARIDPMRSLRTDG